MLKYVKYTFAALSILCVFTAFVLMMLGTPIPRPDDPTVDYIGRALIWAFVWAIGGIFSAMFESI